MTAFSFRNTVNQLGKSKNGGKTLFSLSNVQFSFLKVTATGDCSPTRMLKGKVL